jgi:hypothetical protein
MKKIVIAFVIYTNVAFAQDTLKTTPRITELGVTLNSILPISGSLNYKKQIGAKTFFKLGFVNLLAFNRTDENSVENFKEKFSIYSAGLSVGLEFRTKINNRVSFCHGSNLAYSYYNSKEEKKGSTIINSTITRQTNSFSIPYNFGFLFKINNHFLIGIETSSSATVDFINVKNKPLPSPNQPNGKLTNFDFSIKPDKAFLYFTYRF